MRNHWLASMSIVVMGVGIFAISQSYAAQPAAVPPAADPRTTHMGEVLQHYGIKKDENTHEYIVPAKTGFDLSFDDYKKGLIAAQKQGSTPLTDAQLKEHYAVYRSASVLFKSVMGTDNPKDVLNTQIGQMGYEDFRAHFGKLLKNEKGEPLSDSELRKHYDETRASSKLTPTAAAR